MEADQIEVPAFAVIGDLEQIHHAEKAGLARQHRSNIRQTDRLDGVHFDLAFFHRIAASHFDARVHPHADATGDVSTANALAEPLGEHHEKSLHREADSI